MAAPTVQVLLYLLGAWVDVSAYVSGQLTTNRGRSRETDRFTTGSASFVLRNETRLFDPTNTASIYYPGIVPRTPVRVNVAGSRVFTGYVDDYDVGYQKPNICTVTVSCLDAFSILANTYVVNQSLGQQFSGARIAALLALNSYSGALNIASGQATIQAGTYGASFPGDVVLDDMQAIAASEWGYLYMDRSGTLQFQDRYWILEQNQGTSIVPAWTLGGTGGNRLSAVDSSLETGLGTWAPNTNCTVAQSAAQALDGTHSLAMTSVAAGNMYCQTANTYPVVAGVQYMAIASLRAAASPRPGLIGIVWYTSAGSYIGYNNGTAALDTTTGWTQVVVSALAPAGAAFAQLTPNILSAGGASELHYIDCGGLYVTASWTASSSATFSDVAADLVAGNLLSAVDSSFETGLGSWIVNANCTLAQSTAQALDGTHSLAMTSVAAGNMAATTALALYPVVAGQTYTWMVALRAAASPRGFLAGVLWYNSVGGLVSSDNSTGNTDTTSGWTQGKVTAPAPVGAVWAAGYPYVQSTGGAGEVHYVDCAGLFPGAVSAWGPGVGAVAVPYFDVGMISATRLLYNQVSGTRNGGTQQRVNNAASQTAYQLRSLTLPTVENVSDAAVFTLCQYVLGIYQLPQPRFDTLEVELAGVSSAMQAALAALDITSLALVKRTPPGGGTPATISIQSYVESIAFTLDVSGSTYRVKYGFGVVAPLGFLLDSASMGCLDINAIPY